MFQNIISVRSRVFSYPDDFLYVVDCVLINDSSIVIVRYVISYFNNLRIFFTRLTAIKVDRIN